ncbi:MAG TPA: TonB-dependent receptor plug domain-containing protein [Caulobacterales bacterium]|nr:TonB-dependent receptor plug domain-containing protein [Caulobacterales bacterium]
MDLPPPTDTIVVVAPRLPPAPGEAAFSSYVIDEDALSGVRRLDAVIAEAPGATLFRRNDSAAANPTIQGLSLRSIGPSGAGRALVTLDGAPLNDPFGGWVIWGALPPETIAGARVVRGAGAGPYGAGALTGMVALDERDEDGVVFDAEAGGLGDRRLAALGEAGDGAFDAMLAASVEHQDGWIPVREGRGAADQPLWLDAMSGVARVQAHRGRVIASARLSGYAEDRGAGVVNSDAHDSGAMASFTLVAAPDAAHLGWRLQAWAQSSDLGNRFVSTAPDRSTTTPANTQLHTPATGWGVNGALRWGDASGGGEAGVDVRGAEGETQEVFRYIGGAFTRSRVAGGRTLVAGAYVEAWRQAGPWLLTGGARVDDWRAYAGKRIERDLASDVVTLQRAPEDAEALAPTARLGARRELGSLYARGAIYAGFRPPTLNELHRPFRVGDDITEANPSLDPEKLYGADAGVGGAHWEFGAFYNELVDPVTNVTLGMGPGTFPPGVVVPAGGAFRQRRNAGLIRAWGLEAEARGQAGALSWRIAANYAHARVDGGDVAPQLTGLRPAQSPAWSVTGGLEWALADTSTLRADLSYESERFEDDLNSRSLGDATRLDMEWEQKLSQSAAAFLAIDNATDADIATAVTADGVVSYAAPRALRVGVRFRT